jgi:RNA polymerase sigma-70 factor, ECF subfamily
MDCSATLPRDDLLSLAGPFPAPLREGSLDATRELERFLKDVERRAFRIAEISLRNADDALDVVQEAMIQLARTYGDRPSAEWKPLFHRILQNRIHDYQRRRRTRSKVIAWWTGGTREDDEDAPPDPIDNAVSPEAAPGTRVENDEAMAALETALGKLPDRQRQAFLCRNLEGLDVAETAAAMGCSEGSVKTHYFRALKSLREQLGEHWP